MGLRRILRQRKGKDGRMAHGIGSQFIAHHGFSSIGPSTQTGFLNVYIKSIMHAHNNARYIYSSVSGISVWVGDISVSIVAVLVNEEVQVFCGATLTVDMCLKAYMIKYECIM